MHEPDGIPPIPQTFRDHFKRHNRQAFTLGLITLGASLLLWATLYYAIYAVALIFFTAIRGTDADISRSYPVVFGCFVVFLCGLTWVVRRVWPNYFPVDQKHPFEIFLDVLLAVPRATFEIWGNFSAIQFPTERELRAAWKLIVAMGEPGKHFRISIQQLPLLLPKQEVRERVIFLLQLVGMVSVRKNDDELWLVLDGERAKQLAKSVYKIEPEPPPPEPEPPRIYPWGDTSPNPPDILPPEGEVPPESSKFPE